MPTTIDRIGLNGLLDLPTAILLAIGLGALCAWFGWRQRHGTSRGWNIILWGLRVTAIVLLLGMLIGPTQITEHRTETPQLVAVMVDSSESMDVRDEPDQPQLMRWQLLSQSQDDSRGDALKAADRASAALGIAEQRCRSIAQSIEQLQSLDSIHNQLGGVSTAINRCEKHLQTMTDLISDDLSRSLSRLRTDIGSRFIDELAEIDVRIGKGDVRSAADLQDVWNDLSEDVTGLDRRLNSLVRRLADRLTLNGDAAESNQEFSRRDHVIRVLSALTEATDESNTANLHVRRWQFADQPRPLPAESSWESGLQRIDDDSAAANDDAHTMTNLSAALSEIGREGATSGIRTVVLISDGAHNSDSRQSPQEIAAALGDIPVYVVPIGRVDRQRDIEMYRVDAPNAVVEDDMILIDVILTAWDCDGDSTTITLFQDGTEVERRPIEFTADQLDYRLSFQVKAEETGRREFELTVDPVDDEARMENNSTLIAVEVVRDKMRILLSDRTARWEHRYLEQLFRRDEHVEFDRLLFSPTIDATGKLAGSKTLPADVDGWDEYDVVILGDLETSQLNPQSQTALDDFVRKRGGNLVVIAGREYMPHRFARQPLEELLPVVPGRSATGKTALTVRQTTSGKLHPALLVADEGQDSERVWQRQFESVPVYWLSNYSRSRPTSEVLLTATDGDVGSDDSPGIDGSLMSWHRVGAGRVVYLAAPVTYNLRFRRGDRYHHRFWGQLLRWLTAPDMGVGTDHIQLSTDRSRYESGQTVSVTLRLKDLTGAPVKSADVGAIARDGTDGETHIDLDEDGNLPGRYVGEFRSLATGAYGIQPDGPTIDELLKATDAGLPPETLISVEQGGSPEQRDTRCNLQLLQQVAEVSGGRVIPPTALDEVLALSAFDPKVATRIEKEPLWNHWLPFCLALGCLIGDWGIRKRLGLV